MRILLDESTPRQLKRLLPGHEVETVPERGWASKKNGELLRLAVDAGFDVFVTADAALPNQQDLSKLDLAVVVLAAGLNRMSTYETLADRFKEVVDAATEKGTVTWLTV